MRIALTIDTEHWDRPAAAGTQERVVDELERLSARASFFLQGRWAEAYPDTARRIASGGHLIGNHSQHHAPMDMLTDEGIEADVTCAREVILAITGAETRPWFRCPFGDGSDDPRVRAALDRVGYRHQHWDVDVRDWEGGRSSSELAREVVAAALAHGDGAVVLLHSWPHATGEAIGPIVGGLRDAGARLVGLDETVRP